MTLEPTDHTQCQPPTSGGCQHGDPHCPARNAVDVTLTHEQIMARHVPRTAVPIEQCIGLINAALDYRDASRASTTAWLSDGDGYTDADEDRIGAEYVAAHNHLVAVINSLPERDI